MLANYLKLCVMTCGIITMNKEHNLRMDSGEISSEFYTEEVCQTCYEDWKKVTNLDDDDVTFLLFTRESGDDYTVIDVGDEEALTAGGFSLQRNTKIIIHGWLSNGTNYMAELIRKTYLDAEDLNVICVNWPAESWSYETAKHMVEPTGEMTAMLIDFLIGYGVNASTLHLVGHSLGAHVAGVAGEDVTFGNLTRITGLDPAAPLYSENSTGRLDPADADFVDVIHTCAGYLGWFGVLGTADFYPNGGYPDQPGCYIDITACAHDRSYLFFAESIKSKNFIGTQCDYWRAYKKGKCAGHSKSVMGEHVDLRAQGVYYLHTNRKSPFAKGNSSFTNQL